MARAADAHKLRPRESVRTAARYPAAATTAAAVLAVACCCWPAVATGAGDDQPAAGKPAAKTPNRPAAARPVGPRLQRMSVNVVCADQYGAPQVEGSGTLVICQAGGHKTTWVLTAHHVVKSLREVKTVIGPDGEERKRVTYRDAKIVQEQVEGGRAVGEFSYDARVVNVDPRRDIALLRVRKDDLGPDVLGATFYLDDAIPPPGTPVLHCGCPGGKELGGTATVTHGIVSRIGVRIPQFGGAQHGIFDQSDCAGLGGSSGGLIALRADGRWIGMLTLGLTQGSDSFHWFVPIRSVRQWAAELHVEWLLDPGAKRPSQKQLDAIPLELNPAGYAHTGTSDGGGGKARPPAAAAGSGAATVQPDVKRRPR